VISYGDKSTRNESIYKYVILDCSPFNYIDSVGVKLLIQVDGNNDKTYKNDFLF
jgi:hypothetical protein